MKYNTKKQKLLLEYLISSADTFALCKSIIQSVFFEPTFRKSVEFLTEYYDKYNSLPTPIQIEAETDLVFEEHNITKSEISYCADEIEKFCQQKALELAVLKASEIMHTDKAGDIRTLIGDAFSISLTKDLGVQYFENPTERLEQQLNELERTPTMWHCVDDVMGGGLARSELLLFSANSGGGKSITLANLAVNFLAQKLNVLYLSLELSEALVAQRFDIMYTGITSVNWKDHYKEIAYDVDTIAPHMGKLTIKRMPADTNANAIRGYLKEFELKYGYIPDLLIVDYLDKMGTNGKVDQSNISIKDKKATQELYDILIDYKMFGATASQQNREAISATELNQSHIAGGLTKVNESDWYISIISNATMKAAGAISFAFLKTRSSDGTGKIVNLHWDNTHLRIMNLAKDENITTDGVITNKIQKINSNKPKKQNLLDIMDI